MKDSVFTLMLKGEIPREIVYEDDLCFVIPTLEPLTPGHLLVIPNEQIDSIWDTPDDLYHHLFDVAKQMAAAVEKAYGYKRVGMIVEGFGVPHAHIHILGLNEGFEPTTLKHIEAKRDATPEELKETADKLRTAL
jgi:histidine triad (HIT) family protein